MPRAVLCRRLAAGSGTKVTATWCDHGFANLERGREARSLNTARRREERSQREAEKLYTIIIIPAAQPAGAGSGAQARKIGESVSTMEEAE